MRIGLRVILQRDEQNPEGVGATMRLKMAMDWGPNALCVWGPDTFPRMLRLGSWQ